MINNYNGLDVNRRTEPRRCYHKKSNHEKHFLTGNDKRVESLYSREGKFEKLRIHFDYTYTLKYEEKILKELIIPPVKKLLENTLKIRRFPGKIRFPRNIDECEGVPIPPNLKYEGVDADLIIIVSTQRGMKKYKYEKKIMNKGIKENNKVLLQKSSMMDYFKHRLKKTNLVQG